MNMFQTTDQGKGTDVKAETVKRRKSKQRPIRIRNIRNRSIDIPETISHILIPGSHKITALNLV